MKVKFTDLYKLIPQKKKILSKLSYLIKKSKFVGGDEVKNFEKNFAKYTGSKYCVSLGNGTDALEIAVKSLNLRKGSEIIVPVNTWISTAEAVKNNGYKIIFCDIDLRDYSLSISDLKRKINSNTSAVIVVHLYGNPSDMYNIKKITRKKNIRLIEDCAQAHGSRIKKKHVGTFGDIGTFSFFPGKNLGAFGDGGAIITNSKKISNFALRMRNHGALNKYDHNFSGRNSRLDTLNAAVLNHKLKNYKKSLNLRKKLAKIYFNKLETLSGIQTYKLKKGYEYGYHQFVIRTNSRDKLKNFLEKNNIDTMIHYPYMLNELNFFPKSKTLKNSKKLGKKILSLPISEEHSQSEILYVANKISLFFKNQILNK